MPPRRSSFSSTLRPLYGTPRWSRICTTWPEKPHIGNCGVPFMNSTTSLPFSSLSMNCSIDIAVILPGAAGYPSRATLTLSRSRIYVAQTRMAKQCKAHAGISCQNGQISPGKSGRTSLAVNEMPPARHLEHGFPRIQGSGERCSTLRRAGLQRQRMQLAAHFGLERLVHDLVLLNAGFAAKRFGDHSRGIMVAVAGEIADRHLGIGNARADQAFDVVGCHCHGASPRGATLCR